MKGSLFTSLSLHNIFYTMISSREGYNLNNNYDFNKIKITNEDNRKFLIVIELIRNPSQNSIDYLAEKFFVSDSTIKSEIRNIRKFLFDFNIKLEVKNNKILLDGTERNFRKVKTHILYEESKHNFYKINDIQWFFNDQNIDVQEVLTVINDTFSEMKIFINDYALTNLLLHVIVSLSQIKEGIHSPSSDYKIEENELSYKIAQKICHDLERKYFVKYKENDIQDIAIIILSIGVSKQSSLNHNDFKNIVSQEVIDLVTTILKSINDYYYIDLYDNDFFYRFAIHINNLLKRLKLNRVNKNPLTSTIKENTPLIYDSAVNASHFISKFSNMQIPEDEIAFIAFHLGGELEKQKKRKENVHAILYFPTYHNLSDKLYEKISRDFEDSLFITDIVHDELELKNADFELMISIHDAPINFTQKNIKITPFYTEQDKIKLEEIIKDIGKEKTKDRILGNFREFIKEQYFYSSIDNVTKDTILKSMSKKITEDGFVPDTFYDEIVERETISSTAFGNLAIPHTLKMSAYRTVISIGIFKKPIDWNGTQVKFIILLAISKNDRKLFVEIFDVFANIFTHPTFINKIDHGISYEQFMNIVDTSLDEIL